MTYRLTEVIIGNEEWRLGDSPEETRDVSRKNDLRIDPWIISPERKVQ